MSDDAKKPYIKPLKGEQFGYIYFQRGGTVPVSGVQLGPIGPAPEWREADEAKVSPDVAAYLESWFCYE